MTRVEDELNQQVLLQKGYSSLTLDIDATIKTLRWRLIQFGATLVRHARRYIVKMSRNNPWHKDFLKLRRRILSYS